MQIRGLKLGIEYATEGSWKVADRPIELIIEDDAGDATTGGRKARELIEQQDVDILQGAVSSATAILLAGIAEEYGRVCWLNLQLQTASRVSTSTNMYSGQQPVYGKMPQLVANMQ